MVHDGDRNQKVQEGVNLGTKLHPDLGVKAAKISTVCSVLLHFENECIHAMYEGKKQAKITDFFSKD